ncbi:hypothetical protein UY3_15799 [Chelonia mydas]|uniref:Uncharacterized protein n=1 Tax=Chelonia mydas TaxID=8469 RepID=M7AR50_CHEMY|nr:hypothetical protein UY3_15799 [Chelonia mydas]
MAARAALQVASDVVDSAARNMASAIFTRRASWLLLSGLSTEAQQLMQDLPFDGQALFAEQTDTKVHGLKDSRTTLKTQELYVPDLEQHQDWQSSLLARASYTATQSRAPGQAGGFHSPAAQQDLAALPPRALVARRHTMESMEPAQITVAVMSTVNTSHIILQYVQNQNLQKQARRRWQRNDESDEDMDTDFSQSTGPGNLDTLVAIGQAHAVEC